MATKTNTTINGNKYYRITRTIGHRYDQDGLRRPVTKQFYGPSKRAAEQAFEKWKEDQRLQRERKNLNRTPFGQLAELYSNEVLAVSGKYAQGTIERYQSAYRNWIKTDPALCSIPICDLTAMDLQLFFNRANCTQSNIAQTHQFLFGMFKWLVLQGICTNLLSAVEIPKKPAPRKTEQIITWSEDELRAITTGLASYRGGQYRLRFFVICGMLAGLRISEQMGLKYSDFRGDILVVERQYYRGELKTPKRNSAREIPIHPALREELAIHRSWHEEEMQKRGYQTEFVFTTADGKMLDYKSTVRSLARFYRRIDVPVKKFHAYRATFCTLLCASGVPIQVASKLLGHKSIEVTAQYYTAVDIQSKRAAVEQLPPISVKNC